MTAAAPAAGASASAAHTVYAAHPQAKAVSKLDAAAQDFEAVFLTQMMQAMFTDVGDEGPLGGGAGTDAYRSMLADQYGRNIAASGGVGIAAQVRSELLSLQQGS
ncbi:rod-binding protein [Methylopila sp. Yamaguchi]|uniref:rod-binding protein n=1 Tax=Methylopila sp. Yamaguchi TaxID=1437817 RepID=UPI000CB5708A|nr:rod-binding protein [Methylopila sp. Yamaguchi]GBD50285.1 hypothetical protein METY_3498 [Methylopila sp. Yamaguchi]